MTEPARLLGWPPPSLDDLVMAAAGAPERAGPAWSRLAGWFDVDGAEGDRARLLAAVAGNLTVAGVAVPPALALRVERTAAQNAQVFAFLGEVLDGLYAMRVPTLVAGSAVLAVRAYPSVGNRAVGPVDLYVPLASRERTVRWLLERGFEPPPWRREIPGPAAPVSLRLGGWDSGKLVSVSALPPPALRDRHRPKRSADIFWSRAESLGHTPVGTRGVEPAHQVALALVHTFDQRSHAPLRGFADAAWTIRSAPDLDWAELRRFTVERRAHLPVLSGLRYVHEVVGIDVPPAVLDALARAPVTRRDRAQHWARVTAEEGGGILPARPARRWLLRGEASLRGDLLRDLAGVPARAAARRLRG